MTEHNAGFSLVRQALVMYVDGWKKQVAIYVAIFALAMSVALIGDLGWGLPEATVLIITVAITFPLLFLAPIVQVILARYFTATAHDIPKAMRVGSFQLRVDRRDSKALNQSRREEPPDEKTNPSMYCPQCGQDQVSDKTRYCRRCGFLLDGVAAVLASGGAVPTPYVQPGYRQISARSKGVRLCAFLVLSTLILVPVSILSVVVLGIPKVVIPIAALAYVVFGLLRILYAFVVEGGVPQINSEQMAAYSPSAMPVARNAALQASENTATNSRPLPTTAEIYHPPIINEKTKRHPDKEDTDAR